MANPRMLILAILLGGSAQAATVESGKFRLHKFDQAIGEENYEITSDGELLLLDSKFAFEDRGGKVSLSASLRARADGSPLRFEGERKHVPFFQDRHLGGVRRCERGGAVRESVAKRNSSGSFLHHQRLCADFHADDEKSVV